MNCSNNLIEVLWQGSVFFSLTLSTTFRFLQYTRKFLIFFLKTVLTRFQMNIFLQKWIIGVPFYALNPTIYIFHISASYVRWRWHRSIPSKKRCVNIYLEVFLCNSVLYHLLRTCYRHNLYQKGNLNIF